MRKIRQVFLQPEAVESTTAFFLHSVAKRHRLEQDFDLERNNIQIIQQITNRAKSKSRMQIIGTPKSQTNRRKMKAKFIVLKIVLGTLASALEKA